MKTALEELETAKGHIDHALSLLKAMSEDTETKAPAEEDIPTDEEAPAEEEGGLITIVEDYEWEDVLQTLKDGDVKFRLTEKLKTLEGKHALKWLEALVKDGKVESASFLLSLFVPEEESEEPEEEGELESLEGDELLELVKSSDLEVSKKLKKALKKGKELDEELEEERDNLIQELQKILDSEEEEEEERITEAHIDSLVGVYETFSDFVEDAELEDEIPKKLLKQLGKLFAKEDFEGVAKVLNEELGEEELEVVLEELDSLVED